MVHQDNPRVRGEEEHSEFPRHRVLAVRRIEARPLRQEGPTSLLRSAYQADLSPENLGLTPDLSRLPREIQDVIRLGDNRGNWSRDEARVAVCAAMFRAGYGAAEIWAVMTDPLNGLSGDFFEEHGDQAEATLERIISTAHDAHNDG